MPFLVYAIDYPDMDTKREQMRNAHREHLRSLGSKLLASGALLDDDSNIIGGISLVDTEDRKYAESFANTDPYHTIRQETLIIKWRKRWWDGQFLL